MKYKEKMNLDHLLKEGDNIIERVTDVEFVSMKTVRPIGQSFIEIDTYFKQRDGKLYHNIIMLSRDQMKKCLDAFKNPENEVHLFI